MLKKPCPYHKGSVNHTLEQCKMLRKYYNRIAHRDEDKKKDAGDKGGDGKFPSVENVFFIFGGPTANMTSRQHKNIFFIFEDRVWADHRSPECLRPRPHQAIHQL